MHLHRQPDHSDAQSSDAGQSLKQGVVELIRATGSGLVFWSRHYLEIAAELQLRMQRQVMKGVHCSCDGGWTLVRGFVVECKPARRGDGSAGFEITIVFDPASQPEAADQSSFVPQARSIRLPGSRRSPFGLN